MFGPWFLAAENDSLLTHYVQSSIINEHFCVMHCVAQVFIVWQKYMKCVPITLNVWSLIQMVCYDFVAFVQSS